MTSRHSLLAAANRLTDRDRQILHLLGRHQVLTTHQITRAFFDTPRIARRRVQILTDVGLITSFRPPLMIGSSPNHYVLTPLGLQALAGLDDNEGVAKPRAVSPTQIALRPDLKHLVGVNDVFCALLSTARKQPNVSLEMWWSERACTKAWGVYVRPDGFGRWREGTRRVEFFLEFDTGSEHSPQILAKLPGYQAVADATNITTPVLFWLHSPRREHALHQTLSRWHGAVPVATASGDSTDADPSGAVWRRVGAGTAEPMRLVEVAEDQA